jgi:hypothetical protein
MWFAHGTLWVLAIAVASVVLLICASLVVAAIDGAKARHRERLLRSSRHPN